MIQTIEEKIKQRRRQMLVHSYIYYELNQNIVSDSKWAKWAKELEALQRKYPKKAKTVEYAEMFEDWDGSSGAFLKFGDDIKTLAHILLDHHSDEPVAEKPKVEKKVKTGKKESAKVRLF